MFKYEIGEKVFIKSLNKEGIVTGQFYEYNKDSLIKNISYEVSYGDHFWNADLYYPMTEYLGIKRQIVSVMEKYIEPFRIEVKIKAESNINDVLDSIRYMFSSLDVNNLSKNYSILGSPPCDHIWQSYEGFTQRYDYCTKCDLKN